MKLSGRVHRPTKKIVAPIKVYDSSLSWTELELI